MLPETGPVPRMKIVDENPWCQVLEELLSRNNSRATHAFQVYSPCVVGALKAMRVRVLGSISIVSRGTAQRPEASKLHCTCRSSRRSRDTDAVHSRETDTRALRHV